MIHSQVFFAPGAWEGETDRTSSLEVLRDMGGTSISIRRNLYGAENKKIILNSITIHKFFSSLANVGPPHCLRLMYM